MGARADHIFLNGTILSMNDADGPSVAPPRVRDEAMAISDGRVLLVGSNDEVRATARKGAVVHDMRGKTITPGFIDAHLHFVHVVLHRLGVDCRPDRAPNIPAIQSRISEVAKNTPAGAWIRAWGCDEMHLAERRQPTRVELDAAAPNHPTVLMHNSMHQCVVNTAALDASQIDDSTPNPPNGWSERDRRGRTNGILGEVVSEEQAVTPYEALGLYTTGAAKALRVASECGSLCTGKRADFVILDADPTEVACAQISAIGVEQTWVGGRKVHDAATPPA